MITIKSSAEISRLFKEGRRLNTKDLTLIVLRNEKQHGHHGRAAFIAGKKLGNAVWRNRAKRRLRAICHTLDAPKPGYDIIFLAKRSTNQADFAKMLEAARRALERIEDDGRGANTQTVSKKVPRRTISVTRDGGTLEYDHGSRQ